MILRWLPTFRGKRRVARFLLGFFDCRQAKIVNTSNGVFFMPNITEAIGFELFTNGGYEIGLVELLVSKIPIGGTFIDVGANIGSISIPLAIKRPDLNIYCFEASRNICELLKKNVELNHVSNLVIENLAVSDESNLLVEFLDDPLYFGKGKMLELKIVGSEMSKSRVRTTTLDSYFSLPVIGFLKIDVEGYELEVLMGSKRILETDSLDIVYEDWEDEYTGDNGIKSNELSNLLRENSFKLNYLDDDFCVTTEKQPYKLASKNV